MQFIRNGPDIPERLLQAHEEGRVAFFCGAGISYPAGLPGFGALAKTLYSSSGVTPNPTQKAALKANQYDSAIGLLEGDLVGGRGAVRRELAKILTPTVVPAKATETHKALLTLGRCRNGKLHLITTNFDRIFEAAMERNTATKTYLAPLLPLPKNNWDGLVYLHGLLPQEVNDSDLDCLVVSSGDFGLAYLTERWAARFVSELFRNYTVCFVGYSLDDPILRYMMDALAADRQRGEAFHEMFAFGGYTKGKEKEYRAEWLAKKVTPILYWKSKTHRYLHETLIRWSEIYRDGVRGKEMIVLKEAIANPLIKTQEDDFVGRVLWALSDPSGLPARRFAELDPAPSLDWLEPLTENKFQRRDLDRFGITPKTDVDGELAFSLLNRPTPYTLAPRMTLVADGKTAGGWDDVQRWLALWLLRYLDDPALILWIARRGSQLHERFATMIDDRLNIIAVFERDGRIDEIEDLRKRSPSGIPRPMLRTLWRLLLSHRVKFSSPGTDIFRWIERFKRDGLTPSLRQNLSDLLTPCIEFRRPSRWGINADANTTPQRIKEIVDCNLRLRSDHVHSYLHDLMGITGWQTALPDLLPDVSLLLRDALDLMHEVEGANEHNDLSYIHQPSISQHAQNQAFDDWTALIELVRDAWGALSSRSLEQANLAAEQWQQIPYPLFKRLAFFAAAQGTIIPTELALGWLLGDECWWLWSVETQRETMRLLVALAPRLSPTQMERLGAAILDGPPRVMFIDDLEPEEWVRTVDREVWFRLAKLIAAGANLETKAQSAEDRLSKKYQEWQLLADERDEFPFWTGGGEELRKFEATPHRRRALVEWLKRHPQANHWQGDDWQQRCRDDFSTTFCALYALGCEGIWPEDRWRETLQAWVDEKLLKLSWRHAATLLSRAPVEIFAALSYSISLWLKELSKVFESNADLFFVLCQRILSMDHQDGMDSSEPVMRAINHPVGHVTEALLRWWYRNKLEDNQGLRTELVPVFTLLCDSRIPSYRHARVLLASHAISLFRVDPEWTMQNLLPFFSWQIPAEEARSAWVGFLWSPRLYRPLFEVIKVSFLETSKHYDELGECSRQYAALLTFAALEQRDIFTTAELKSATQSLPEKGLQETAFALVQALEGAGKQKAEYWRNKIEPYWKSVWPKSREYKTAALSDVLARLCITANKAFPEAFTVLRHWLQPADYPGPIFSMLLEQGLATSFPDDTLAFLDAMVGDTVNWPPGILSNCLGDIKTANPGLEGDKRYRRLLECIRRDSI
jgi:hypothetical protein